MLFYEPKKKRYYREKWKIVRNDEKATDLNRVGEALDIKLLSFKPVCETRWADLLKNALLAGVQNYAAVV